MVNILLGQQAGFTKYHCFLYYWDSRAAKDHWTKREWSPRETLTPGDRNIVLEPLVQRENIILPPLHIKLGLMKQFVKALDNDVECFRYICSTSVSYTHLRAHETPEHLVCRLL